MPDLTVAPDVRVTLTERPVDWPLAELSTGSLNVVQSIYLSRLTWLRQSHGSVTVTVRSPGCEAGAVADAAVTTTVGAQLLIRTADCAPIVLWGQSVEGVRVLGVAHAGWTGLMAGICESVVRTMRDLGAAKIRARIGPCIGPECYEFGAQELAKVASRFGPSVVSMSSWNTPALDLSVAVAQSLRLVGVPTEKMNGWMCTACEPTRLYSHRARQDGGRLGLLAEILPGPYESTFPNVD